jgi:hypothetical protein
MNSSVGRRAGISAVFLEDCGRFLHERRRHDRFAA